MATVQKIDILTVTFAGELESLKLQVRSVERFFDRDLINRYYIIWNDLSQIAQLVDAVREVSTWLFERVLFLKGSDLCNVETLAKGWLIQQVLKLKGLAIAESKIVLVLDTKNHLIAPFGLTDIYSERGLPLVSVVNYGNKPAFKALLDGGLDYFDVETSDQIIAEGLPTTTPYLMYSEIARGLISYIEKREEQEFERSFLIGNLKYKSTEFLLYYSYLLSKHGGISELYDTQPANSITFFKSSPKDAAGIKMAIGRLQHPRVKFLAIHRVRMPRLSDEERCAFIDLWVSRNIFESQEQCIAYIESFT